MSNNDFHLIKWRHGDYIKLGKAVSKFNQKIRRGC